MPAPRIEITAPQDPRWRELLLTATAFRDLTPWRVLPESALLAVENPATGETGYGSTIGGGGDVFGMSLFLGDEGLGNVRDLFTAAEGQDTFATFASMRALSLTLNDRDDLETIDRQLLTTVGIKCRGRAAWPRVRSLRPRRLPWLLDLAECEFLTIGLQQVMTCMAEPDNFFHVGMSEMPVRMFRGGAWTTEHRGVPRQPAPDLLAFHYPDPDRLARLGSLPLGAKDTWQMDLRLLPTPMDDTSDGGPPRYPEAAIACDGRGMVLGLEFVAAPESAEREVDAVLRVIERAGWRPRRLTTSSAHAYRVFSHTGRLLGIEVKRAATPTLDRVLRQLVDAIS